jgi:hypothetical protein
VFDNKLPRAVFGPKRHEVTRLKNCMKISFILFTHIISMNKLKTIRRAGHVARMVYRESPILIGNIKGNTPLEIHGSRWDDSTKVKHFKPGRG